MMTWFLDALTASSLAGFAMNVHEKPADAIRPTY